MALTNRIRQCTCHSWTMITQYSFTTKEHDHPSRAAQSRRSEDNRTNPTPNHAQYASSFLPRPTINNKGGQYIHKLKYRIQVTLRDIEQLEYRQQNGAVLDAKQMAKIKRKHELRDRLEQIQKGTFKLYQHHQNPAKFAKQRHSQSRTPSSPPNESTVTFMTRYPDDHPKSYRNLEKQRRSDALFRSSTPSNSTLNSPSNRSPSSSIVPLKRHQITRLVHREDELDLNEKFEKLLSRPTYSIWAVRELLASFNHDEWPRIPTSHIRHVLDAYYVRNDLIFVYKILMKWFTKKMGNRYALYADLCKAATDTTNLKMAHEVFQYLVHCLMTCNQQRESRASRYYDDGDIPVLLYHIYDALNGLIPKLIECGHFEMFDDLVSQLIELQQRGIIPDVHGVMSNSNLALLWKSCVQNESITRLFVIIEWINQQRNKDAVKQNHCSRSSNESFNEPLNENEESDLQRFVNKLDHSDIMKALVLAINANNNQLFIEIMSLCGGRIDGNFTETIVFCIEHQLLHSVLSEETTWSLSRVVDIDNVQLNDVRYFRQILDSSLDSSCRLGLNSWNVICRWFMQSIHNFESDNTSRNTAGEFVNDLIFHFAATECMESLRRDNIGDAQRWMELIGLLLCDRTVAGYFRVSDSHRMHGVLCGLQMMGFMRSFRMFADAMNLLPDELLDRYCVEIVECIVSKDVDALSVDDESGILISNEFRAHGEDAVDINVINRAFKIIQALDEVYAAGNIVNKGWIKGERAFRLRLQDLLQNIDQNETALRPPLLKEMQNGIGDIKQDRLTKSSRPSNELNWFDALSDFAFKER